MSSHPLLMLGWTTVSQHVDAEHLATMLVKTGLAACVQIEGPIISHYRWEGRQERTEEYRLFIKFISEHASTIETWLHAHHPYQTPEWVAVNAAVVGEKYLSWARANSTSAPL
jgi:periplasmic divalent cation tolerance protein